MKNFQNKFIFHSFFLLCYLSSIRTQRQAHIGKFFRNNNLELKDLNSDYSEFFKLLKPICIKRVSDTPGNHLVRQYLNLTMQNFGWNVELDEFQDVTPYGKKNFANIIASLPIGVNFNSDNLQNNTVKFHTSHRVIFACHYDSKFFNDFDFIGAIDSAVPCALLLDLAKFLKENFSVTQFKKISRHLQFIFFDGEEAFKDWTSKDSIYGSRYHANSLFDNHNRHAFDTIDLFVLLDLIGANDCKFPNFYSETSKVYNMLMKIETLLLKKNMLKTKSQYYFTDIHGLGRNSPIEDDHIPFLRKDVPILHLIPLPFPFQWHTQHDTIQNLNPDRIQDLRLIFKYFLLQILNVSI